MDLTDCDPTKARVVELPYAFGDVVYHKAASEKKPGIVTGFQIRQGRTMICVVWGHDFCEGHHNLFELTTEFVKDFTSE